MPKYKAQWKKVEGNWVNKWADNQENVQRKEENGEDQVQKKRRTEQGQVAEATDEVRWTAMGGSIQINSY